MDAVVVLRWLAGSILAAFGALVIVSNIGGAWTARRRGRGYSSLPFLGGAVGAGALLTLPIAALHRWCWVPFVVDLYSLPLVVLWLVARLRR